MDLARVQKLLERINPRVAARLFGWVRRIPAVRRRLEAEYATLLARAAVDLKPYPADDLQARLPSHGRPREEVLARLERMLESEAGRWQAGYASGAVYHGGAEHVEFINRAYALHSQSNPLHPDLWPGTVRFEAEIVAMTAAMLNGEDCVGTVTSGGTESILLAVKAYRDHARERRGITRPEMVLPVTAHAAFDKACEYFRIAPVKIPVDDTFRAGPADVARAVGRNTIVVVGSAPAFPHGTIDRIGDMSRVAAELGVGFHTDACLGGFLLPWAEKLGYETPQFDFRLPGVTSISTDTHKYGYAAKGTSVVLYRDRELRRAQYFTAADWPGGLYASPTLAGSRPGGLSAACWAAMTATGEDGYLANTKAILETAARIRAGIEAIPALRVLGDPLWVIAFAGVDVDVYRVMEAMTKRGWSLNGLQQPPAVHLAVTMPHTRPGVAGRFLTDLEEAVAEAREAGESPDATAPLYGMAASFPVRGVVEDLLERYLDLIADP